MNSWNEFKGNWGGEESSETKQESEQVLDYTLHFATIGEASIFKRFLNLYLEAKNSKEQGLEEAHGMLLRKALETLIIDYLKFGEKAKGVRLQESSRLESIGLMNCVELIEDISLRELAKRAVLIGNDNVHTKKKWNNVDTSDLKRLIGAIVLNIFSKLECLYYVKKMQLR
jgi:hypothetical protein